MSKQWQGWRCVPSRCTQTESPHISYVYSHTSLPTYIYIHICTISQRSYRSTEHPHEHRVHQHPPSLSGWTGWRSSDEKYIPICTMWVPPAAAFTQLAQCWDPVIKIFRVMPVPKLRCKQDHISKSIEWILFNSKCERERECVKDRKEVEGDKGSDRQIK